MKVVVDQAKCTRISALNALIQHNENLIDTINRLNKFKWDSI